MQSNLILLNLERTTNSFFKQHKTLSNLPFQRFIPISAFYPHFSVLSPFQRFIPISVLSPFQCFIPISAFYPHFSVLSPFQFPFPPFSFSVLSRPHSLLSICRRFVADSVCNLNVVTVLRISGATVPLQPITFDHETRGGRNARWAIQN